MEERNRLVPLATQPARCEAVGGGCVSYNRDGSIDKPGARARPRARTLAPAAYQRDERTCFPVAALFARVDGTSLRVLAELRPVEFCFVRRSTAETMLRSFF